METTLKNYTRLKNNLNVLWLKEMKLHLYKFLEMISKKSEISFMDIIIKMTDLEVKRGEHYIWLCKNCRISISKEIN